MERYPALRLACMFGVGILIATAVSVPFVFPALLLAGLALCAFELAAKKPLDRAGLSLLVIGLGAFSLWIHANLTQCSWEQGRRYAAVIDVVSEPRRTETGWRFLARVRGDARDAGGGWQVTARDFTVLARLPEDPDWAPRYGDRAWAGGEFVLAPVQRNPGNFNYRDYLDHNEVSGIFRVDQAQLLSAGHGHSVINGIILPARRHVRAVIAQYLRGDEAALLSGLALGERNDLSKRVLEAFSNTGTTHVLAVSGLHVVLAAFIIYMLLRLLQTPKRWAGAGTIAGLSFYTLLTGAAPSITRATIMASCGIVGMLFERKGSGLNSLGLAALLILSWWPQALFDAGFQLSFAATFGILALTRPVQDILFRISGNPIVRQWLLLPLAVSVAAQVATAPVIAWHFHRVPMVSLAANLVVVPLTNLLLAIGLCMSLLGALSLAVIRPLAACAWAVSWLSLRSVELFDGIKIGTIPWPRPDAVQVMLYGVLVYLAFRWRAGGQQRLTALATGLLLTGLLVWRAVAAGPPGLKVTFLDVGQGDAALIEFPNGRRMLIDTGPSTPGYDAGERAIMPFLRSKGISRLDEIMVTHSDGDHSGGLAYLLGHVWTGRLMVSGSQTEQPLYFQGLAVASASQVSIDTIRGCDTLIGISPCRGYVFGRTDSAGRGNEASLVAVIQYGAHTFFFTGDMGPELEDTLKARGLLARCTVLKVPHHGSRINSAPEIIGALRPELCVIPVGDRNRFGHPSPEVVSGYRRIGAKVLRTDHSGAIIVESDGREYSVTTMTDD